MARSADRHSATADHRPSSSATAGSTGSSTVTVPNIHEAGLEQHTVAAIRLIKQLFESQSRAVRQQRRATKLTNRVLSQEEKWAQIKAIVDSLPAEQRSKVDNYVRKYEPLTKEELDFVLAHLQRDRQLSSGAAGEDEIAGTCRIALGYFSSDLLFLYC